MGKRKKSDESLPATIVPSVSEPPAHARANRIRLVLARIHLLQTWLAEGMTPSSAALRAQEPEPHGLGLSRATANRYTGEAIRYLCRDDQIEPMESKRARLVAILQANAHEGRATGQIGASNQAVGLLAELWGLRTTGK